MRISHSIFTLFVLSVLSPLSMWGADSAGSVIKKCADKIRASKSLIVDYTLTSGGQKMDGSITIAGNCFSLSSPGVRSWYDGKTQWTYSAQVGEVNITEPTAEELAQVNPFAILDSFSSAYNASTTKSASGTTAVRLSPKDKKSDITGALVTISNSTGYPSAIKLNLRGGQTFDIKIKSVTPGGLVPVTRFRFNKADYPGLSVVDLR